MASMLSCDIISHCNIFPLHKPRFLALGRPMRVKTLPEGVFVKGFHNNVKFNVPRNRSLKFNVPRSSDSSNSSTGKDESSDQRKAPFGYSRKDVILIGVGVTAAGYGLKSGLELLGVDPLQAGNVVQLVFVLGLTIGWISTYIFRVSNKEMTYAQQLRDYESKVMEKRLESLTEAELQVLIAQVEEEKNQVASGEQAK